MTDRINPLRRLELPRRWEFLEEKAAAADVDPSEVVERVDDAANRVDALLKRVRDGGGGVFEVFFGLSGSGKTTFLKTIQRFFDGVRVTGFPKEKPITALPDFIRKGYVASDTNSRIVLIERRDNPTADELASVEQMFGELLNVFRETGGAAVVLWPITKPQSALQVSKTAWEVGRDSMADAQSNGQFHFKGVDPAKYWTLADNTSRTLTGDSLEAFGIKPEVAANLLPKCETISDFFNSIVSIADGQRSETWSVLKARSVVHVWVLLPGDDVKLVNATADALTQGTKSKIDIDKIGEFIDRPDNNSIYVADWKTRRGKLAHLLRAIDMRLFSLPPNVALAAIRSFGDASLKTKLKQSATPLDSSKTAMRASRLYKAILSEAGIESTPYAGARHISRETEDEFLRVQAVAARNDKPLNKALGLLLELCLQEDAPQVKVLAEKKALPSSSLQPDIQIELRPGEFICLEPTWRTGGRTLGGIIKAAQNTLSEAHLKKYVLDKATQYVKDLGL